MPTRLSTGLVVQFALNDEGRGMLSAELDSRVDGLNQGRTSFVVGDSPGFLVFSKSDFRLNAPRATLGSIATAGIALVEVEEWVFVANQTSVSLPKPLSGGFTILSSYGDAPGTVRVSEDTLAFDEPKVAVLRVRYQSQARQYRLTGVGVPVPVLIYVSGSSP